MHAGGRLPSSDWPNRKTYTKRSVLLKIILFRKTTLTAVGIAYIWISWSHDPISGTFRFVREHPVNHIQTKNTYLKYSSYFARFLNTSAS